MPRFRSSAGISGSSVSLVAESPQLENKTGDILVMYVNTDGSRTVATPTGWSLQWSLLSGSTYNYVFYRVTTADNETIDDLTLSADDTYAISVSCWYGFNGTLRFGNSAQNTDGSATPTWNGITTSAAGSVVLMFGGIDADIIDPVPGAIPMHVLDAGGNSIATGWNYYESTSTASGTRNGTADASDGWVTYTLELLDDPVTPRRPVFFDGSPGAAINPSLYTNGTNAFRDALTDSAGMVDKSGAPTEYTFDGSTDVSGIGTGNADTGTAGAGDGTVTFTDATKAWTVDEHKGRRLTTTSGSEIEDAWIVLSNTATTLTLEKPYDTTESGVSYQIEHAVRINVAVGADMHLRTFRWNIGGTAPTGITAGHYFFIHRIDASTITLITAEADLAFPYNNKVVNSPVQVSAAGSGTITLRESGITLSDFDGETLNRGDKNPSLGNSVFCGAREFTTHIDLSGSVYGFGQKDPVGASALYVVFIDSDGDWKAWQTWDSRSMPVQREFLIDVANNAKYSREVGTFNPASVKHIVAVMDVASDTSRPTTKTFAPYYHGPVAVVGGDTIEPASLLDVYNILNGYLTGTSASPADGVYVLLHSLQIGNGTDTTIFDEAEACLAFPPLADGATTFEAYLNFLGLDRYSSAGDSVSFTNSQIRATVPYDFSTNASSAAIAADFSGSTLVNATVSVRSFDVLERMIFVGGNGIDDNGSEISDSTISGNARTDGAVVLTTTHDLSGVDFVAKNASDYAIKTTLAASYSLPGITFSGYTASLNPTHTSGTATFSVLDGGDTPTLDGTWIDNGGGNFTKGSATVVIQNTVAISVTAKDGVTTLPIEAARVYLKAAAGGDLTAGDLVLGGLTDSSGVVSSSSFNYTSPQPVEGWVRKGTTSPLYQESKISGTITAAGLSLTTFMASDE